MSIIKHHFNNSYHYTTNFTLFSKTLFLKTKVIISFFVKIFVKSSNSPKVGMHPWSPLPRHLKSYPCKKFQKESSFQPIYFEKRKSEVNNN